jgi:hypothetical protein
MHLQFRGHILPSAPALYWIWGVESGDRGFDWGNDAFCLKSIQPCQLCYGNHVKGNPRPVTVFGLLLKHRSMALFGCEGLKHPASPGISVVSELLEFHGFELGVHDC